MLFSIVTVTRNNLDGLKETAASITAQICRDYEWIVVDGGSGDGTTEWLQETGAEDWISEPDHGIYDAMNKGLEKATGAYVLFLNGGDRLAAADTLAFIAETVKIQKETPDFIYGDSLEDGFYKKARSHTKIVSGLFTHHQAMLYRRALLGSLRYDLSYHIAADYKFTALFLRAAKTVLYCPFPLCIFEPGGLSQKQATQGRNEQFRIRHEIRMCTPLRNRLIRRLQATNMVLRRLAPALYWQVKRRGDTS